LNRSAFPAVEKLLLSILMKEDVQAIHKIIRNNNAIDSLEDLNRRSMGDKILHTLNEYISKGDEGAG
jgi:divalent metal cation (Fe/Co/Zn/Cd) transporter